MREPIADSAGAWAVELDPRSPDHPRVLASGARDILVVDDTAANLVAAEAALAPLGRRLVLARSGVEALQRLLDEDFALILLDVSMPGMDGYECARLIRSRERSRRIPIIFITAFARDEAEVMQAYQLGAVDFLFKPVHPEILRAKASVFCELQDAQERERERQLEIQRKQLETAALEREMASLAEADRRKDEFLAILAHELRNPLAPIQTSLELMRQNTDRPVPPRILEILGRQVRHVTRLVDDLLDISRITAGKIDLRRGPLRLADVIEEALVASRPLIEARRHSFEVRHPDIPSPVILGDSVRLVQVIANVLNNAAKYTDEGGRIELEWGCADDDAWIRVRDNGRGIAPELIARVFDMFVQERVGSDGAGGLGLGLALVRRLIELHGGSVTASSPGPGKGSVFEIRLPICDEAPRGTGRMEQLSSDAQPQARSLRAVVIDDNPDLRELVADLLTAFGHEVKTAPDGVSGLAMIREQRPDVALVDIGLPGLDGYALARAVREELADHPVRLVAMTGYGQENDRARALEAGFDVHIVKPASAATILRALGE